MLVEVWEKSRGGDESLALLLAGHREILVGLAKSERVSTLMYN